MEAKAYLYDLRISPRKVSIVLDLIRNKDVATAAGILANTRKAASEPVAKLLKSAVANAENNHSMDTSKLGRIAKRIQARDKGRAYRILKRSSHITIAVKEKE